MFRICSSAKVSAGDVALKQVEKDAQAAEQQAQSAKLQAEATAAVAEEKKLAAQEAKFLDIPISERYPGKDGLLLQASIFEDFQVE